MLHSHSHFGPGKHGLSSSRVHNNPSLDGAASGITRLQAGITVSDSESLGQCF
eukprot:jgi/Botrbrau1/16387/Bobra.0231s0003.1